MHIHSPDQWKPNDKFKVTFLTYSIIYYMYNIQFNILFKHTPSYNVDAHNADVIVQPCRCSARHLQHSIPHTSADVQLEWWKVS